MLEGEFLNLLLCEIWGKEEGWKGGEGGCRWTDADVYIIGLPRNERGCAAESRGLLLHGAEGEGTKGVHDDEVDGGEHVGASWGELV